MMATSFGALCTDFYVNQRISLKMDLPTARETILDLFDRIRRSRPGMDRFRRFDGELALESAPKDGAYEWMALRATSIRSGAVNPDSLADAYQLHRLIMEVTPYFLSISPLDIECIELMFGFDLETKGNHDQIVFDALYEETSLGSLCDGDTHVPTDCQPYFTCALDEAKTIQANYEVKTRTSEQEVAEEKFEDEPISVYLSIRQDGPVTDIDDMPRIFETLAGHAEKLTAEKLIPLLLTPISRAIQSSSC
ncbi:MAG: hypothetical protein D8M59_06690 [Planctomycetes bacterium]|nr:hypothetical protein [Planctomycetota bacterium]NOG55185.1 hypothetical protein [Planctomycetota bacterium]